MKLQWQYVFPRAVSPQAAEETQHEFEKREVAIQQLEAQLEQQARQAEQAQQALRQETQQEVCAGASVTPGPGLWPVSGPQTSDEPPS